MPTTSSADSTDSTEIGKTEAHEDDVVVMGNNIFDGPLYKGPAKCVVILNRFGKPKILHCKISDTVWGTVTNAEDDFGDWLKRYGVDE